MLVPCTFSLVYRLVLGAVPIKLFPAASHLPYLIPVRNLFRLCLGDPVWELVHGAALFKCQGGLFHSILSYHHSRSSLFLPPWLWALWCRGSLSHLHQWTKVSIGVQRSRIACWMGSGSREACVCVCVWCEPLLKAPFCLASAFSVSQCDLL